MCSPTVRGAYRPGRFVGPALDHVAEVDDEGAGHRVGAHPLAVAPPDLEATEVASM